MKYQKNQNFTIFLIKKQLKIHKNPIKQFFVNSQTPNNFFIATSLKNLWNFTQLKFKKSSKLNNEFLFLISRLKISYSSITLRIFVVNLLEKLFLTHLFYGHLKFGLELTENYHLTCSIKIFLLLTIKTFEEDSKGLKN